MNFKSLKISLILCMLGSGLYAQSDSVDHSQDYRHHEIKIIYGIGNLPNGMHSNEKDVWTGGFTVAYMYWPQNWLGIGINANWQFPSDTKYYSYREYYVDDSFKDYENSAKNTFFAFAPEIRLPYSNKQKYLTSYFALSFGYGIEKGIKKGEVNHNWGWNFTLYGFNANFGKEERFFAGGELGVGYKGIFSCHTGYRF
ncbi:MAG: hypothetical protein LBN18_07260 [Dysgonamonadaceae bacterium]|nr:hypothetical protein [Dysgonamonadaceae bacterium]